jgi:sugar phosphate isomerase/epimerase
VQVGIASSSWSRRDELPFHDALRFAHAVGTDVVDVAISAGWPVPDPLMLRFTEEDVAALVAAIRTPIVTVVVGRRKTRASVCEARELVVCGLAQLTPKAETQGITLALEGWTVVGDDPPGSCR